jgi:hypothetical protein
VSERVNSPSHYKRGGFELADVIDAFDLPRWVDQAAQYLFRAGHKHGGDVALEIEDLEKAAWNIRRRIAQLRKSAVPPPATRDDLVFRLGGAPTEVTVGEALAHADHPDLLRLRVEHYFGRPVGDAETVAAVIAGVDLGRPKVRQCAARLIDLGWRAIRARAPRSAAAITLGEALAQLDPPLESPLPELHRLLGFRVAHDQPVDEVFDALLAKGGDERADLAERLWRGANAHLARRLGEGDAP